MSEILTEVGIKYAITRWKEKFGTQPDINSQEFKDFQKQVNRDYNYKQQTKADNDNNIGLYVDTLSKIIKQTPQSFPQEFYNALTNLQKKGKIELCKQLISSGILPGESRIWVEVIGNLYNSNKNESAEVTLKAMTESAKYPWIDGIINHKLMKEDDFNLDNFDAQVAGSGGMDISSDSSTTDTTSTDSTEDQNTDFNLDDMDTGTNDLHITPADGGIDSIGGGMGGEDIADVPPIDPNAPVYRVIDVIFNSKDPEIAPKIKVQNMDTGEIEIKDIYEIDV